MATLAKMTDEISLVEHEVRQIALPTGISFARVESSHEWTGEPAWRVYFTVPRTMKLDTAVLDSLQKLDMEVFERVQALNFDRWPFVIWLEGK